MKIALVLEGGAMRGMYTSGVLDVMMDESLDFDGYIGVSAGLLFGVNYLSKQKGRALRYNKKYAGDKRYMGISHLIKEGNIVSTDFAYGKVQRDLDPFDDETFKKANRPFYSVTTSVETGEAKYIKIDSVFEQMEVLRASASMPFFSRPVILDGKPYLDGAVADPIPYLWMLEQGYDKVVVVLTRDITYVKKPTSKSMIFAFYGRRKNFSAAMKSRADRYNASIEHLKELEKEGVAFVIRPSLPIDIKRTESDPDALQKVYDLGVSDAKNILEGLKEFLKK